MLGSIIGDIVGSIYEFHNIKTKEFPLFSERCGYTDDSILTIATAKWILEGGSQSDSGSYYFRCAINYPRPKGGYGEGFFQWMRRADDGNISKNSRTIEFLVSKHSTRWIEMGVKHPIKLTNDK